MVYTRSDKDSMDVHLAGCRTKSSLYKNYSHTYSSTVMHGYGVKFCAPVCFAPISLHSFQENTTSKDIEPSLCNINCRNLFLTLGSKIFHQIWSKRWLRIQYLLYSSVVYCNTFNACHQQKILNPTDCRFFLVSAL